MERPGVGGSQLAELTDYDYAYMLDASAVTPAGSRFFTANASNLLKLWLYNEGINGPDNNLLSSAKNDGASTIHFVWHNYP